MKDVPIIDNAPQYVILGHLASFSNFSSPEKSYEQNMFEGLLEDFREAYDDEY